MRSTGRDGIRDAALLALLFALLCGCGGDGGQSGPGTPGPIIEPPVPADMEALEPKVRDLFDTLLGRVRQDPHSADAWFGLGMAFHAAEMYENASACYEQSLRLDQRQAKAWYQLARVRGRQARVEDAIDAMGHAIELDPGYAPALWRRGEWLIDTGKLDAAQADFDHAMQIDPDNTDAALGLAKVHLRRGETAQAIELLEGLLSAASDEPYAHFLLGSAYRAAGRSEDAERELRQGGTERVIRNDPWAAELLGFRVGFAGQVLLAVQYLTDGQPDVAVRLLEPLHEERPDDVRVATRLGQAYLLLDRADDAVALLEDATQRHPDDAKAHSELGAAYHLVGRDDDALAELHRSVELNPEQALPHSRIGGILEAREDFEGAAAAFEQALVYTPGDPDVLRALGDCRSRQRRWKEAVAAYGRATRVDSQDPELFARYGLALTQVGDLPGAAEALETSLQLGPKRPDAVQRLLSQVRQRIGGRGGSHGDAG